ncbi:hypothetical protein KMW28_05145 [Flammeovirga yaeyamensis]|uniref:DUF4468 domain-containing protein n=1 Tax=Flammeovirga yaeyamensis TaxID=367791 RepID=A0AAX1N611_9BACT|nr:hypothetical protein [Flammeovirga yaeyamensis]MBB3697545.1 hypothetical protein [Flammeovirga yaeyamensis]NMF36239.1 hypothetical protein [Flammeovirga yaeyamensis]QWG02968.1 hypothetical protein KMW28_05145 [Flammeovirga yaeyamensis]
MQTLKLQLITFLVMISSLAFGQSYLDVVMTMKDGSTLNCQAKTRNYIVVDEGKSTLKCKVDGAKKKIEKSEIKEIMLGHSTKYTVKEYHGNHYIGQIVSSGALTIFKVYNHGHHSGIGFSFGTSGMGFGSTGSAVKYTVPFYLEIRKGKCYSRSYKEYQNEMTTKCPEIKEYFSKKIKKADDFERVVEKYNKLMRNRSVQ